MKDSQNRKDQFAHLVNSPLTSLRGAIDLLRQPPRTADDPTTRELLNTLDRCYARLRTIATALLAHSTLVDDTIHITTTLSALEHPSTATPVLPAQADAHPLDQSCQSISPGPHPPSGLLLTTHEERALSLGGLPEVQAKPSRTVLVAEANQAYRAMLRAGLSQAGFEVIEATDGIEAIDLARFHRPDLVLLDIALPELSGQQTAQILREDPETKAIPLIYLTSDPEPVGGLTPHSDTLFKYATTDTLVSSVQQAIEAARRCATHTPTILIVDDEADIQHVLGIQLQEDGYRTVRAMNGAEALIRAQEQQFDLIILDLRLPDIDGFSILAALRARSSSATTPIILLSTRDTPHEKVHGLQLGADDYVTKPFSSAELQARVRAALRRSEREGGANPSTRLPGNIAIERAIRHQIEHNLPFAVCYVDLDNFKAYNDTYGFLKGDAVIHQTAHILLAAVDQCGNQDDFVGHIGGDDFVVITTPDRAGAICSHALSNFDTLAPLFYDIETRARGYIDSYDRQGRPMCFPIVSLSIAVISTDYQPITHPAEVAQRSVELKKRAKEIVGSSYVSEGDTQSRTQAS